MDDNFVHDETLSKMNNSQISVCMILTNCKRRLTLFTYRGENNLIGNFNNKNH